MFIKIKFKLWFSCIKITNREIFREKEKIKRSTNNDEFTEVFDSLTAIMLIECLQFYTITIKYE